MTALEESSGKMKTMPTIRYFLWIFIPTVLLVSAFSTTIFFIQTENALEKLKYNQIFRLFAQERMVPEALRFIVSDLLFLSELEDLKQITDANDSGAAGRMKKAFLTFAKMEKIYDQVRFIDHAGRERVRVDFHNGLPAVVPDGTLQFKGNRDYFKEGISRNKGGLYVSPLDLNVEQRKIEMPEKPMIRFATPVFDIEGKKIGIVVLNYLAHLLVEDLRRPFLRSSSELMLLNRDGYWLICPNADKEWGFMYEERKEVRFQESFPEAWRLMGSEESGEFMTGSGLFSFTTIYPLCESLRQARANVHVDVGDSDGTEDCGEGKAYRWTLLLRVPPDVLHAMTRSHRLAFAGSLAFLVLLAGSGAFVVARQMAAGRANRQAKEAARGALLKEKQIVDGILNAVGEGVLHIDESFQLLGANQVALDMCNPKPEKAGEAKCFDLFENALCHTDACVLKRILAGEKVVEVETAFHRLHETDLPVFVTARAIRDKQGNPVGLVESIRDLRELKKNVEKTQMALELRALAEGYAQMSALLLHNMGNALTSIQVGIEQMQAESKEMVLGFLRKCYDELTLHCNDLDQFVRKDERGKEVFSYMGKLIDSMQQAEQQRADGLEKLSSGFARISNIITLQEQYAVNGQEVKEPLDLSAIVEGSIGIQSFRLRENGIHVEKELDHGLPRVTMERKRMRFLANELIGKATQTHGHWQNPATKKSIRISTFREKGVVVLEVLYKGCGRFAKEPEAGFESEMSGAAPSDAGLYYCGKIMKTNNGTFSVSKAENGSECRVRAAFAI